MIQFGKLLTKASVAGKRAANSSFAKGQKASAKKFAGRATAHTAANAQLAVDTASKFKRFTPHSAIGTGAIVAGVGIPSFFSGVNQDNQISNSVYDLAFGDPNFDEYVMGKKMGMRSLMMPVPGERFLQGLTPGGIKSRVQAGTGVGAAAGYGAGALFSAGLGLKGIRGMAVKAAGITAGAALGTGVGVNQAFNNQPYRDAWRANRKNRPQVDGSMAFGMYNARLG